MVKSLKELGIPDYSEEEFLALDDLTKYVETLKIEDNGEELESSVSLQEKRVHLETIMTVDAARKNGHFLTIYPHLNLQSGWECRLNSVETRKDLFDFCQSIDGLGLLVYRADHTIIEVRPYFTDNFRVNFREFGPEFRVTKKPKNQRRKNRSDEYPRVIGTLYALLTEDNFDPIKFREMDSIWEIEKAVYPYYIVLRREYHADKHMLRGG